MSAQFSKGDRVEVIASADEGIGAGFPVGATGTVHSLHLFPNDGLVFVCIDGEMYAWFMPANLRKIEPEFVVGQQVSGDEYARLPVGSKAAFAGGGNGITKVGEHEWHDSHGCPLFDVTDYTRTLTHLPDAAEPEDKADLYVEPEPLKEDAEPAFNDDDVHHLKVISGSTTIFDGLAVFEEADSGNINVTPVPRCTSLNEKAGSILRCGQHEGHSDGHWTVGSTPAAAWSDERAYGRVVEGGAS